MHGPDLLYLISDPWPWGKPHEAAGLHRTCRQQCSLMAARGARAAAGEDHWTVGRGIGFAAEPMDRRLLAAAAGTVTGLSTQTADLATKRLELLREVIPSLRRLAMLVNVGNPVAVLG